MAEQKEVNIWDLADLCTPWCVHTAATLRIANYIAAGVDQIDDLARAAGCDAHVLHALLGHLVRKGLFEEPSPGRFALNAPARDLLDPIVQISLDLETIGGRMAHAWSTMLSYVRTGDPAYQQIFGLPFFEDLAAHPQISADFDKLIGPAGHGTPNPYFELSDGWAGVKTLVDVGGGTGAMLAEVLRARPHMRGILVDQPGTAARSGAIFQAAGVADRATAVGQSFFDALPLGADIYLLRGIINDWPDRESLVILQRCAEAASASPPGHPSGRVVVLKSVGQDGAPKDLTIEMVLLGGKHRTLSEFRELSRKAGLEIIAAGEQPSGYFVTECRPV